MKSNQFDLVAHRNRRGVRLIMKDFDSNAPVSLVEARKTITANLVRNNEPRKVARIAVQEALWWLKWGLKNEEDPRWVVSYRAVDDGGLDAWVWCVTRNHYGTVTVRTGIVSSIKEMAQAIKQYLRFYRDSKGELHGWLQKLKRYYEPSSKRMNSVKEEG